MLRIFLKPSYLLYSGWIGLFILSLLLPVNYLNPAKMEIWCLIGIGLIIFTLGEKCSDFFSWKNEEVVDISNHRLNQVVLISSLLSIFGIFFLAYDKVILSGLDYTKGFAYIRQIRDIQLSAGIDVHRSIFLYLGYPLFSLSYPALMLLCLHTTSIRPNVARLAQLSVCSPIIYSLLYGGRMPVLILILLIVACCFIRILLGKSLMPERLLFPKLIIFSICFVFYNNYIFSGRIDNVHASPAYYLEAVENSWGAAPSPWLNQLADDGWISERKAISIFVHSMYLTHGVVSFQKIVNNYLHFRPYWGTYQVGILSPLLRVFYPSSHVLADMQANMIETNIYGFYTTVWGALFLDFGLVGAILFIVLWGFVSGVAYKHAKDSSNIGSQLILAFCYVSIPMSIFNAPFGMANSFLIFAAIITAIFLLKGISIKSDCKSKTFLPVSQY